MQYKYHKVIAIILIATLCIQILPSQMIESDLPVSETVLALRTGLSLDQEAVDRLANK